MTRWIRLYESLLKYYVHCDSIILFFAYGRRGMYSLALKKMKWSFICIESEMYIFIS